VYEGYSQIVMTFALGLVAAIAVPTAAATLEWKFAAGDEEHYQLTQSARLSNTASKPLAEVKQDLDLTWKVLEVTDDGSARISLTVSSFSFLGKGPDGQEVRYDSQATDEPQGYAAMLLPIGKRLAESAVEAVEFTMSPNGAITEMKLPDELSEALKSVPSGKKFAVDGGLRSFEVLARLGAPLVLPTVALKTDEAWSQDREMELPVLGQLKAEFTYKIAGVPSDSEASIDQTMSVVASNADTPATFTDQRSSGKIKFNVVEGRPETSTLSYDAAIHSDGADGAMKLEYSVEFRRVIDQTQ
jgi:hypothetical protein